MSKVLVIDSKKRPLEPIYSAQARQLLRHQKAAVYRRFPFTLILKESRPDKVGLYVGRIATRATGSFNISTKNGLIQGISYKTCKHIHKKDGYSSAT